MFIGRDKIDEFRTVVLDGRYAFGVYVGAVEGKFANGAYKSAERSGGGILITVYNRMCRDLVRFIVKRFYEHIRVLENRNRLFILDYNVMFYSFSITFVILTYVLLYFRNL